MCSSLKSEGSKMLKDAFKFVVMMPFELMCFGFEVVEAVVKFAHDMLHKVMDFIENKFADDKAE